MDKGSLTQDVKCNKSVILNAVDELCNTIIVQGMKDLKTTYLIYELFYNLMSTNKTITRKVVAETRLFETFHQMLENCR